MSLDLLPPIPAPPHDPTSLLADRRIGWPILESTDAVLTEGSLTLAASPGALRALTEASGSFGGLRTPANVAWFAGDLWLLDDDRAELMRFDPCTCSFEPIPCFGGSGNGSRQLAKAGGIAVTYRRLYLSDTGNARLAVYVLPSMGLAALWKPPGTWNPAGVAVGRNGDVFVVDSLNGAIHRFSHGGDYLGRHDGVGASTHIMVARDGVTIYVSGALEAFRVTGDGAVTRLDGSDAHDIAADIAPLPLRVDRDGAMLLGMLCTPPDETRFDLHGNKLDEDQPEPSPFQRTGLVLLGPFDSLIDRCVWHRVIIRGEMPGGASVMITTQTSDIELPVAQLADRPWETRLGCTTIEPKGWDGLITGAPGRYLWLRLELVGNGSMTPVLRQVELEFPRISLRRYMPAVYGGEPRSADFTDRFLSLFDRELRDVEQVIDSMASLFDPLSTPALDWLGSWIGEVLPRSLPERRRREMLARTARIAAVRGTRDALWKMLVTYLGLDTLVHVCQCEAGPCSCRRPAPTCPPRPQYRWAWTPPPLILEHYRLRRWLELGAGRLGDQAVLWGKRIVNRSKLDDGALVGVTQLKGSQDPLRDPFHVYAHKFTVFVPAAAACTPQRRHEIEQLVAVESPAHTAATIEFVEPRLRIGFQSMIGLDAVVARVPQGVALGETPVGPASVLTGSPSAVVATARIGATAVIE